MLHNNNDNNQLFSFLNLIRGGGQRGSTWPCCAVSFWSLSCRLDGLR